VFNTANMKKRLELAVFEFINGRYEQWRNHAHRSQAIHHKCEAERDFLVFFALRQKSASVSWWGHRRRKDFSREATRRFFQNFSRGAAKSGEICFFPLENKKTAFLCWNFQNPERGKPTLPPPSHAHYGDIRKLILLTKRAIFFVRAASQANKKCFVKRQRMLNRFGVKSGALSLKMHLVLPNWL